MSRTTPTHPSTDAHLPDRLTEWVGAGLLSEAQAAAIRQHEVEAGRARPVGERPGPSLVVEALGYIGALVMVVGAGILVGVYWPDLPTAGRLGILGGTAALLLGTGFVVLGRTEEAAVRLRAVLWAAGVVATAGFMVVLSDEVLDLHDEDQVWLVGAVTAAVGGALWMVRRTWVQLLAFFVPVVLTAVGVTLQVTDDETWAAGVAWAVGVLWAAASWASWITPRVAGVAFGAFGAVLGALSMDRDLGIALGVGTAAGSLGQFIFAPLGQALIQTLGWMQALTVLAAVMLAIPVLAMALAGGAGRSSTGEVVRDLSLGQALGEALKHRSYLLLTAGFFVCGFHIAFITTHLPPYIVD